MKLSFSPGRILRLSLGGILLLQVITAFILIFVTTLRRKKRTTPVFPHVQLDEVAVDENKLQLYCYGHDLYQDMYTAIDNAQQSIYIESYIWKDDEAGQTFKTRLAAKAEEGIDVYVIFDSFGNLVVPREFKTFHPRIHVLEYQSLRHIVHVLDPRRYSLDHRKLLIVDGQISFIGGYNISSLYEKSWRDTHLRIQGPASGDLAHSFIDFWNCFCDKNDLIHSYYPRRFDPLINLHGNDALHLAFPIRDMYIEVINRADHTIYLTNAYFMPDHVLLDALKAAAKRGVDVRILVPLVSNHVLADWVTHGYFSECLQAGIHILCYQHAMLHAKTCTIDGQWSTVGTANLDRLSSIGNCEINVEIYSQAFAQQMELLFKCDTEDMFELTGEQWHRRPFYTKLSEHILAPWRFMM